MKGIAFSFPKESSNKSIYSYKTSIDKIEEITGIDFYNNLDLVIQNIVEVNKDLKISIMID